MSFHLPARPLTVVAVLAGLAVPVALAPSPSPAATGKCAKPTPTPTAKPTVTAVPTAAPTQVPTAAPTAAPTEVPTQTPTEVPTATPTEVPTETPTEVPTEVPTATPTEVPTETPTEVPTEVPTETPTEVPTEPPAGPSTTSAARVLREFATATDTTAAKDDCPTTGSGSKGSGSKGSSSKGSSSKGKTADKGDKGAVAGQSESGSAATSTGKASRKPKIRLWIDKQQSALSRKGLRGRIRGVAGTRLTKVRMRVVGRAFGTGKVFSTRRYKIGRRGRFAVRAPGKQACRVQLTIAAPGYQPRRVQLKFLRVPKLQVTAKAGLVHYGGQIGLTGRITGDAGASRGQTVRIQALAGTQWIEAGTAVVGASGALDWTHTLTNTEQPSDYSFRAVLPKVKNTPWGQLASASAMIRIRP